MIYVWLWKVLVCVCAAVSAVCVCVCVCVCVSVCVCVCVCVHRWVCLNYSVPNKDQAKRATCIWSQRPTSNKFYIRLEMEILLGCFWESWSEYRRLQRGGEGEREGERGREGERERWREGGRALGRVAIATGTFRGPCLWTKKKKKDGGMIVLVSVCCLPSLSLSLSLSLLRRSIHLGWIASSAWQFIRKCINEAAMKTHMHTHSRESWCFQRTIRWLITRLESVRHDICTSSFPPFVAIHQPHSFTFLPVFSTSLRPLSSAVKQTTREVGGHLT